MDAALGNTFDGILHEFSGIRIDNFQESKTHKIDFYLLTHAHDDHLTGLAVKNKFSGKMIYCSSVTKEILKLNPKFQHVTPYLKDLELNTKHEINYRNGKVLLSLIPSNHCPGSVMFLIEDIAVNPKKNKNKSVLCTGDIRAEKWWIDLISRNPILFPYTTNVKSLDNIYLDTTYGYRGEPFIKMQDNYHGLRLLTYVLDMYPKHLLDDEIGFFFTDSILGFEDIWIQLGNFFNQGFHFNDPALRKRNFCIANHQGYEFSSQMRMILGSDDNQSKGHMNSGSRSRFHVCGKNPLNCKQLRETKFRVRVKACIDVDIKTLKDHIFPRSYSELSSQLTLIHTLSNGARIFQSEEDAFNGEDSKLYINPKGSDDLLSNEILYFCSRHSSYEECRNFVDLFRPKQVYPMTECLKVWNEGFQMERHFGDLVHNGSVDDGTDKNRTEFIYDVNYRKIYGPEPIFAERPKMINKFDPDGSFYNDLNKSLIKTNLNSLRIDFKGQQEVRTAFKRTACLKDVRIQRQFDGMFGQNRTLMGTNQYRYQKRIKEDIKGGLDRLCKIQDQYANDENNERTGYKNDEETQDSMDDDNDGLYAEARRQNNEQHKIRRMLSKTKSYMAPEFEEILVTESQKSHNQKKENHGEISVIQITDSFENSKADDVTVEDISHEGLTHNGSTLDDFEDGEVSRIEILDSQIKTILTDEQIITSFNEFEKDSIKTKRSLISSESNRKKTKLNLDRIKEIEKTVKYDLKNGFFEFGLECCK